MRDMSLRAPSDDSIESVSFEGVQTLSISDSTSLSENGFRIISQWPIECLDLYSCSNISSDEMTVIAGMSSLRSLGLMSCVWLIDRDVEPLQMSRSLRTVHVQWCYDLGDGLCRALAKIPLESLALESLKVTDAGIQAIAKIPSLRELVLMDLLEVSDVGLLEIAHGGSNLTSLGVYFVPDITDRGVAALGNMTNLEALYCVGLGITPETIGQLRSSLPNTIIDTEVRPINPK